MWPFKRQTQPAPDPEKRPWFGFSTDPRTPAVLRTMIDNFVERAKTSATQSGAIDAMDGSNGTVPAFKAAMSQIPDALLGWYASQGFIGYQTCAMIAQHWLVDKACTMPARDAVRHGFEIMAYGDSDQTNLSDDQQEDIVERVKRADRRYRLFKNMVEFVRMGRLFGVRVAFFKVRTNDTKTYYESPFNPDGIEPGSYEGIVQVDPYWCIPQLSGHSASDPASMHFYDPEYWIIRGQKYHRSHLIIFRNGAELPDFLKPMYMYGGISVPQRIYERVYAAERTANEAPQLAMTKRTMVQNTDLAAAWANPDKMLLHMQQFAFYRDNYGTKLVDLDDQVTQHDTSLADLDAVIMSQYQIVAAAAGVPVTKLFGTSPKGFNSTGEYDARSYHEELETVQANDLTDLVNRHHLFVMRSEVEPALRLAPGGVRVEIDWNPVDSPTAKEYAEINKLNADTDAVLVGTGAIDAIDVRNRLRSDNSSGYTDLAEIEGPDIPDPGDDDLLKGLTNGEEGPQSPPIADA